MYQQFFHFKTTPFSIAPDPYFIYMSEHHQEGLAHLLYGVNQGGGFVALTGEVGTGKTTLCNCLLEQLPDNVDIALVFNPKLNAIELLATVCDELHIAYQKHNPTLKGLIDCLNKHLLATYADGRRTVLMIDEAQNLSLDVLEQIRLLTNLETSKTKLIQIILVGQPELKLLLEQEQLRQLNQRITARYHLGPLSYQDTQKYIKHRLTVCGGDTRIFNRGAIRKVYRLTQGIPRLINILSDRALLGAYVTDTHTVTTKIINKAAKEVFNSPKSLPDNYFKQTLLGFFLIAGIAITISLWLPDIPQKSYIISSGSFKKPVVEKIQQQSLIDSKPSAQKSIPLDFISLLKQQKLSLNAAIPKLAQLWNKEIDQDTDCKQIEKTGLKCLLDKTDWSHLITLNRPVIMEFSFSDTEKSYALFLGLKQENPVFYFGEEKSFPVEQVLALWEGYYLMLWQPPVQNIAVVYPEQSSEAVFWIRKQLTKNQKNAASKTNSAYFGEALETEVIKFQKQYNLNPDGIVGPRTFIHLANNDPQNNDPKLRKDY